VDLIRAVDREIELVEGVEALDTKTGAASSTFRGD
jgi:hypothetical protein